MSTFVQGCLYLLKVSVRARTLSNWQYVQACILPFVLRLCYHVWHLTSRLRSCTSHSALLSWTFLPTTCNFKALVIRNVYLTQCITCIITIRLLVCPRTLTLQSEPYSVSSPLFVPTLSSKLVFVLFGVLFWSICLLLFFDTFLTSEKCPLPLFMENLIVNLLLKNGKHWMWHGETLLW